jgi:hypothetical protein
MTITSIVAVIFDSHDVLPSVHPFNIKFEFEFLNVKPEYISVTVFGLVYKGAYNVEISLPSDNKYPDEYEITPVEGAYNVEISLPSGNKYPLEIALFVPFEGKYNVEISCIILYNIINFAYKRVSISRFVSSL